MIPYLISSLEISDHNRTHHTVTLVNLATHNAGWGPLAERLCKRFGYDKVISATSGSEATDTAVKIARKWGIVRKGIPANEMLLFGVGDSFHGLTSGVWNLQNATKTRAGEIATRDATISSIIADIRDFAACPRIWT